MVFLVIESYLIKSYWVGEEVPKIYILGIYTSEEAVKERLESERGREHDRKESSSKLSITEVDIDKDLDEEVNF